MPSNRIGSVALFESLRKSDVSIASFVATELETTWHGEAPGGPSLTAFPGLASFDALFFIELCALCAYLKKKLQDNFVCAVHVIGSLKFADTADISDVSWQRILSITDYYWKHSTLLKPTRLFKVSGDFYYYNLSSSTL